MLPNREGLFHAYPVEIGVDETGPNKLTTAVIRFRLFEELKDGQWQDCFDEGLEIVGYFYLECRDGSLNEITLDSLKNALGWDGRDVFWLQETHLAEHPVQVKLGFEQYNGKTRLGRRRQQGRRREEDGHPQPPRLETPRAGRSRQSAREADPAGEAARPGAEAVSTAAGER